MQQPFLASAVMRLPVRPVTDASWCRTAATDGYHIFYNPQWVAKLREDVTASIRQQEWVESQVKDAPQATDKEAEEFYQKNPQQFEKAEQVRASHILIALQKDAEESVVAEKKKAAEAIIARVKAGEAFDKLANRVRVRVSVGPDPEA